MTKEEYKLHQRVKYWNIFFSIKFVILNFIFFIILLASEKLPTSLNSINVLEFILLSLVVWRFVRLFVYDNITLFLRELFMDLKFTDGKYSYSVSENSFKHTLYKLLMCPWCFGVWSASVLTFFYFLIPELMIFYIIMSISAVGSLLQIFSNFLGWHAEGKKKEVQKDF